MGINNNVDEWDAYNSHFPKDYQPSYSSSSLLGWCMENGERGQLIIKEYDKERNVDISGEVVSLNCYMPGSMKTVFWKCSKCGHVYENTIYARVRGTDCPLCRYDKQTETKHQKMKAEKRDLLSWCQKNGAWGQKLINEWDYEENEKEGLFIDDVSSKNGIMVHWKCSICGNKFVYSIGSRTLRYYACTQCSFRGSSFPEVFLFETLKQIFPKAQHRKKINQHEIDIIVPEIQLCIEYNGSFWHRNKSERDKVKKELCNKEGYRLISITDDNNADNSCLSIIDDEIRHKTSGDKRKQMEQVLACILEEYHHSVDEIDTELAMANLSIRYREKEDNLEDRYPCLIKEWDPSLNYDRTLKTYSVGMSDRVKWKCCKCHQVWETKVKKRIWAKSACPYCGYNVFTDTTNKRSICKKKHIDIFAGL